jgi:hypothetical protein
MVVINQSPLEDAIFPGREFLEAIAYRLTNMEKDEASVSQVVTHIKGSKEDHDQPLYPNYDDQQITVACHLTDQLLALGSHPMEICRLATLGGGWHKKSGTYPNISDRIKTLCKLQNIESPQHSPIW